MLTIRQSRIAIDHLRASAIARSLFSKQRLDQAIERLGFVQADPIRAPARAQDLTLRHRVRGYRAGDLDRQYPSLEIEEDFFVNYGFLPRKNLALMCPRKPRHAWDKKKRLRAERIVDFVREVGTAHPRDVETKFGHGKITNYWGGSSNATTRLLEEIHFRGMLRVARRESGIRVYTLPVALPEFAGTNAERADSLFRLAFDKYAPMPSQCLGALAGRLRWGAPQLATELRGVVRRARERFPHARIDGVDWYWSEKDDPHAAEREDAEDEAVRLLAPFDPIVWDRRRFEAFWGWAYRFEAYTPVKKRKMGYYAMPVLFRDHVIGWANVGTKDGALRADLGFVRGKAPRDRTFRISLEAEIERMRAFLDRADRA
jgi:uncharacterized protein